MTLQLQPKHGEHQEGFVLLAVLVMLLLVVLTLSIAAPKVATDLRRDKETETVERGKQYIRAIRLYYRKNGSYPNTIDQLMGSTDNQRFLRKRYLDPLTGKDDWRLIHLGEAHGTSTGFFGQPSAQGGTPIGGTPGSSPGASPFGSSSGSNGSSSPSTIFGSPVSTGSSGGLGSSTSGSSGSSIFGSSGSSGSSPFGSSSNGSTGNSSAGTSSPGGTSGTGTGTTGSSAFGTSGATFGGAPIVGVGLPVDKASIKTYNKQTRYNLWEFVYDPTQELATAMGLTGGGGITPTGASSGTNGTMPGIGGGNSPLSGTGGNTGNNGFGGGGFNSGNGFGGTPSSGSNPGSGTTPVAPTNPNSNSF